MLSPVTPRLSPHFPRELCPHHNRPDILCTPRVVFFSAGTTAEAVHTVMCSRESPICFAKANMTSTRVIKHLLLLDTTLGVKAHTWFSEPTFVYKGKGSEGEYPLWPKVLDWGTTSSGDTWRSTVKAVWLLTLCRCGCKHRRMIHLVNQQSFRLFSLQLAWITSKLKLHQFFIKSLLNLGQ